MNIFYHFEREITNLLEKFESQKLTRQAWTHEAHLTVGFCYIFQNSEQKAIELMRAGVQKFNDSVGIINSDSSGYHETITLAWIRVLAKFNQKHRLPLLESVNLLLNSLESDRKYLLEFYSQELLFSVRARKEWTEADLMFF
ncbi:MAG: hypothetical protein EAZ97_04370 [Bacteroidetes bacterium]|nr:MAG: hypothetical protein EAZ97_04370 [Bacteroidota bacterium]